jgi:hypothetical protein
MTVAIAISQMSKEARSNGGEGRANKAMPIYILASSARKLRRWSPVAIHAYGVLFRLDCRGGKKWVKKTRKKKKVTLLHIDEHYGNRDDLPIEYVLEDLWLLRRNDVGTHRYIQVPGTAH